jgi:gliding motility-associated-like protein
VTINNCHLESRQTNLAHNIVLEAKTNANAQYTNNITWTPYTTWLGGVDSYKVFRSIDGAAFEEIAILGPGSLSYIDDIEQFVKPDMNGNQTNGHFCYYIEATEGAGNPYGIVGISKSNISCAHQETVVFIPNAFNPNSQTEENRTFKPVITFVNDYKLIIYNRIGEIVFQSTDPLYGWDGRNKGQLLQKGTYVYFLTYRTRDNQLVEKSGQINLVY